jgi:hypothetical protein
MVTFGYPFKVEREILRFYGTSAEQKLLERLEHARLQDNKYSV